MLSRPDIEQDENNCAICHETVTNADSVSLHKAGELYDHRLHLDCLQPFLAKIAPAKCPICQKPVDVDVITHYMVPETALAASIRKDDLVLTENQIRYYTRIFSLEKFLIHFRSHVNAMNADKEKLKTIIHSLDLRFDDIKYPGCIFSLHIILNASLMFPLNYLLDKNLNLWIKKIPAMFKMAFEIVWDSRKSLCSILQQL